MSLGGIAIETAREYRFVVVNFRRDTWSRWSMMFTCISAGRDIKGMMADDRGQLVVGVQKKTKYASNLGV
jgi:hypothetical protein